MSSFLGRISETRENRVKATKAQFDKVRELLPKPTEGRLAIPECMSADDNDWEWEAFAVMTFVMLELEDPEYTLEQAREDSGFHTVRIAAPELSFFYGRTSDKKKVEEHWIRVFDIVDEFDRCPHCSGTRIPAWYFCGWCGAQLRETEDDTEDEPIAESPAENPTS